MKENWDRFPSNIGETIGPIKRNPFTFRYDHYEVWQDGACVDSGDTKGEIEARLNDGVLNVTIDDDSINSHILKNFSFKEISTNGDRIMWSKDIFNTTGQTERNNPDISSLFFKNGKLSKVAFTIHDLNKLVEFF